MSASFNQVVLVGNLTRDPKMRDSSSGTVIADIGLAVNSSYGKGDDKKDEVLFINVTAFGKTAEVVEKYLTKGSPMLVSGRLVLNEWEDKDGNQRREIKVTADRIQLIGSKRDDDDGGRDRNRGRNDRDNKRGNRQREPEHDEDDRPRGKGREESRDRDREREREPERGGKRNDSRKRNESPDDDIPF